MGNGPTKEEKLIKEIATKETLLECPILVDLHHGTIRHRHEERAADADEDDKLKIGYFYHPRLNDFSEDAIMTQSENNRLKYVFKGPSKGKGKKLYYIYGTSTSDKDNGLTKEDYKPQGKGYNWPQSYRKANNLYYDVIFLEALDQGDEIDDSADSVLDDNSSVVSSANEDIDDSKDNLEFKVGVVEIVSSVIERVSLRLLVPSSNIHLLVDKNEIKLNEILGDFRPENSRNGNRFTINLRLT